MGLLTEFFAASAFLIAGAWANSERSASARNYSGLAWQRAEAQRTAEDFENGGNYLLGQANWEERRVGRTQYYHQLKREADLNFAISADYRGRANQFSADAQDEERDENFYRGVSLTAFAVGGLWMVRAIWKRVRLEGDPPVRIQPSPGLDGARVELVKRF